MDSMSGLISEKVERCLVRVALGLVVLALAGLVIHTPMTVFVSVHWPDVALLVKAWKEVLLLIAWLLVVLVAAKRGVWRQWRSDALVWLIGLFAAWHVVLAIGSLLMGALPAVVAAGLIIDLRFLLIFATIYGLVQLYPAGQQIVYKAILGGAVVIVGFACLQLFLPRDFLTIFGYGTETIAPYMTIDRNDDYIRYNSTLRGPNPLGAYALAAAVMAVAALSCGWQRSTGRWRCAAVAALVASLVATYVSYSRAAILGLVVALVGVLVVRFGRRVRLRIWLVVLSNLVVATTLGLYAIKDTSFMHNVILHDNPTSGPVETSNDGHADSLRDGIARMVEQPLGAGVGSTGSASLIGDAGVIIENQFLFVAHEAGWLGIGLFVAIIGVVLRRLWQQRSNWVALGVFWSGVGLLVVGVLLPVFVDDVVALVWWALAAATLVSKPR